MFITNRKTNTLARLQSLKNKIEPLDFLFTKPQIRDTNGRYKHEI